MVKDKSGATVSASTNVSYNIPNNNNVLVCNDVITVEVNPFSPIGITPSMVLEGSYNCGADLEVTLSYNNVNYTKPEVTWSDGGKTLLYKVTDKSTGNSCWGTIKIEKVENCNQTFKVCDTKCQGGDLGDCNSGYTDTDNVEWPCGFDLNVCNSNFANKLTPDDLQYLHGVDPRNTKPQIVNFDCNTIYMYFNDQAIGLNGVNSGDKKIIRSWTVLDWLTGSTYTYIQVFKVFVHGLEICDTLPWNTPAGNCASGHTYNDAIEWPADITINNTAISIAALKSNPDVHPNDVEPVLASSCGTTYTKSFNDAISQLNATTLLITRTWSAFNTQTNVKTTFVQKITLLTTSQASVCAFTYYDAPIEGVNMGLGNTDASGCASFAFIPDYTITPFKDGNARDGVDIMDLVTVYESVLGLRQLNPYQQIAGDVSGTGGISTLDLVTLKNLVDGVTDNWPATVPVWRFLDKNHQIINGNISPINTFINTNNLIYGNEFIGIKMGDINGSYNPDDNNHPPTFTVIKATDTAVNKGEAYELELKSDRNQNLLAVNLEFNIKDAGISVIDVTSNKLPGFNKNEHVSIKDGIVKISWFINLSDIPQGVSLRNNENFISFTFVSNKNSVLSDLFDLNEDASNQIKQSGDIDAANVDLYWESKIINGVSDGDISRLMVAPNPFTESVYVLGLDQDATYEIHNVSGQLITKGSISQSGLLDLAGLENGFYLLHVHENGKKTSIHKLIKVE
ncbi:MAG: T9SS type A sorting domain-containing protein [Saprospiraceae bacterium]|nr:T9SS type A sorting domain-containing protein [Saprospiraceae bacterium]